MNLLRFAILGCGAGAIYGLTALGIVIVYRGSGVVDFAHGAIGMVGAFLFYNARESGTSTPVAWLLALGLGAAIGIGTQVLVMRPLRRAPALSRLIATLGLLVVLLAFGQRRYGDTPRIVAKLLPVDGVEVLPDVSIGRDRLVLLGIGVLLTAVLWAVYRFTRFGIQTAAVAENRRATSAQGVSPDLVAGANWALGSMLAVVAAVLVVNIAGLSVTGLTLLVVPAVAAALVGGFRSFPLTLLGGLLIGVLESEVSWLQTYLTDRQGHPVALAGWSQSVPFLVIIVVLVVAGRALPLRGESTERPPEIGTGRVRPAVLGPGVFVCVVLVAVVFSTSLVEAVTTSAALAVVALSLVVLTGYAGQLSLAQFALAGTGAWIMARLVADHGISYEVAVVAGVLGAIPIGVLVGLPSLRTRGVNLAVATLGLALVLQAQVLANGERTGGITGLDVGAPRFVGVDFDPLRHPQRYALLSLGCFVVLALVVANLRRGRVGRRLVAVRSNERAAAALGISVFGAKLYAFGLAAAIAAVGGILIVLRRPTAVFFPTFSIFQSILVVVYAVIGGIGFVLGAAIGGVVAPGAFLAELVGGVLDAETTVQIALGVALLVVLVLVPDGLASLRLQRVAGRVGRRVWRVAAPAPPLPVVVPGPVRPKTLEVRDVGVRFGGVHALEDVSLTLHPGEVLGLIGPNGAGKTTLIDAVTGFVPAGGLVLLDGAPLAGWSPRRRARAGVGRSFQSLELFGSMTVRDNLRTASDSRDRASYLTDLVWPRRSALSDRAVAAARALGLEDDLDRRPDELPYGTRRRVAIARALATGPSVLLLDEPAAGLDDGATADLGEVLRRLAAEWGLAVLLVEHHVQFVLDVCDRVVVLDRGRVLATGRPDDVRRDRAVVAAYLGDTLDGHAATPAAAPASRAAVAEVPPAVSTASGAPTAPGVPTARGGRAVLLRARGLSTGYGDLPALHDLDLEVREGEVVALLGPNGAGKTATLLALAGELPVLGGELDVLGVPARAPLHRRVRAGLAFVPEERSVIASVSTGDNLRLGRGSVGAALELFPELEPLRRRRAGLLSGGEQQILTLARALAAGPRLLLVDELSLGLAPLVVQRLLRSVRAAADAGVGVVLVEQHVTWALEVADHVIALRRGRAALDAPVAEVRDRLGEVESAYLSTIAME